MLFKLVKPTKGPIWDVKLWIVVIYRDEGSHSCGESRTDWQEVGRVNFYQLLKTIYNFATGRSIREYL